MTKKTLKLCCIRKSGHGSELDDLFEDDSGFEYFPTDKLSDTSSLHVRDIAMSSTATSARVPPLPLNGKAFRHRQTDSTTSLASQTISHKAPSQSTVATNGNYFRSRSANTNISASTSSETISSAPLSNYATLTSSTSSNSEVRYRHPSDARQAPVTAFQSRPSQIRQKDSNGEYVLVASAVKDFKGRETDEISFNRGSQIYIRGADPHDDKYVAIVVDGQCGVAPKSCLQPIGPDANLISASEIQLMESIGAGSFSTVYKALYKNETVAFKKLQRQGNKGFEDACREAQHLNAMDHPNIVKVLGVCKQIEQGSGSEKCITAALVMEYCAGGQLVDLIMGHDFHPPLRVLMNWALQIANALWHMHSHPDIAICHGDVKPHNVLIVEQPCKCNDQLSCVNDSSKCRQCGLCRADHLTLKMTDFGLTRSSNADMKSSASDVCPGTAPYVAPETARLEILPASDVWSFGVVLWQLLTKEAPYGELKGDHKDVLIFMIATQKISLPIPEDCPKQLQDILKACWEQKPEDRPTMEKVIEMIEALRTHDDSQFVVKCDPSALQQLIETVKEMQKLQPGKIVEQKKERTKRKGEKSKVKKSTEKPIISLPVGFHHTMSIHQSVNGYHIHENDSDVSSPFNTLPMKSKTINFHKSTPELSLSAINTEIFPLSGQHTLERSKAVRRRTPLQPREDSIVTETLFSKGVKKTSLGVPIDVTTEPMYDETTIEVVPEKDVASAISSRTPRPSHSRSPSSNSNFYVLHTGDPTPQPPPYDTATIRSNTSDSSSCSMPWTTKLRKIITPSKKHHHSKNSVIVGGSSFDDADSSPKAHLIKNPCGGDVTPGRFHKNNDVRNGQRGRGRSIGPDSLVTTSPSTSTTPSTPLLRPSTNSMIDPDQVIGFPKSPNTSTSPMKNSVTQLVTSFPVKLDESPPTTTTLHKNSKTNESFTQEILDKLVTAVPKLDVVNNPGYVGFGRAPIAKPESSVTPDGPLPPTGRYTSDKLASTLPVLPQRLRKSTEVAMAPPINRPRTSTTSAVPQNVSSDLPTTLAPGFKSSRSLSSGYLTLESTASRTPSPKPPIKHDDYDLPTSAAPILQRPTTLKLHPSKPTATIQRNDAYVQIKNNTHRRN